MSRLTNRINVPSIEELPCFKVRVWRNGDLISTSCKYLPNEPASVFFTAINHSPTRTGLLTTSQFRSWKQLAIYPLQSHVPPLGRTMSGEIQRFFCQHKIRPRWPPSFKTEGTWEVCALAAPVHQAPGSRCIHASEGLAPEGTWCN